MVTGGIISSSLLYLLHFYGTKIFVFIDSKIVVSKLPEPSFREIQDGAVSKQKRLVLPKSYFRFIEKSSDELDDEVEYDMDEEVPQF